MNEGREQLCPWCQTLITWDPEIGPEKECPHCFNELGDYRSLRVSIGREEDEEEDEDDEEDEEERFPFAQDPLRFEDLEDFRPDEYGEAVQTVIDQQEEAPECPSCRDFMLLTGQRQVTAEEFAPYVPATLGKPILEGPFPLLLYVCPHCFRTDSLLGTEARLKLTRLLRGDEEQR